jgi:hypothetical protein
MKVHCIALVCLFVLPSFAHAGLISLNDFVADPASAVTVAADGSSALLEEDPVIAPVTLSNDPFLGDPFVIDTSIGTILRFDYDFTIGAGPGNVNEFGAFVLDSTGVSPGPAFEFLTTSSSSGTVIFDLSPLVAEPFLGFQFQLSALPGDMALDSTVTVSNVQLNAMNAIPEPGSLAIWALLAVVAGFVVRRSKGLPGLLPN